MSLTSANQAPAQAHAVDAPAGRQSSRLPNPAPASIDVFDVLSLPKAVAASPIAASRAPTLERLNEWNAWQQSTVGIIDGLGRSLDHGILPVVTGLNALGINSNMSCEGHLTSRSHPSPMVEIGVRVGIFPMQFQEQREAFENKLREISVPFLVRLRNPLTVGFSSLTVDMLHAIDTPELRRGYPSFWSKVGQAFGDSITDIMSPHMRYLPQEHARRATNTGLLAKVTALVDEFNSGRTYGDLHKPYIQSWEGQPCDLVFGNHPDGMPRDEALLKERQAVAADFGRFLRERFLLG